MPVSSDCRLGIIARDAAQRGIKLMTQKDIHACGARILALGLTFKENCPDIRNTRVIDLIQELRSDKITVDVYDPCAIPEEAHAAYGTALLEELQPARYDAVIIAVAHRQFREMGAAAVRALTKPNAIVFDLKNVLPQHAADGSL